jgi:hypothetical protein
MFYIVLHREARTTIVKTLTNPRTAHEFWRMFDVLCANQIWEPSLKTTGAVRYRGDHPKLGGACVLARLAHVRDIVAA